VESGPRERVFEEMLEDGRERPAGILHYDPALGRIQRALQIGRNKDGPGSALACAVRITGVDQKAEIGGSSLYERGDPGNRFVEIACGPSSNHGRQLD